jgi:mycothiol synthase
MSSSEKRFNVRPFAPDADLRRLVRLLTEVEAHDQDGEDTSESTQRMYLSLPHHDPLRDRWVIEAPGEPNQLIGFGSTWARTVWSDAYERAESYLAVHPACRRKGLGSALLERIVHRARELGTSHVVIHANERNTASNSFLQGHGFQPVGSYWLLSASIASPLESPIWPAGYAVRSYAEVQNRATLIRAMEGYRDMWGHYGPRPGEEPVSWLAWTDPNGILLAFAPDGEVAGLCIARLIAPGSGEDEPEGRVDEPGILPAYRSQGLHRPLVLTAMRWLHDRGCRSIALDSWGDDEKTIALYCEMGFKLAHHLISYQRSLE